MPTSENQYSCSGYNRYGQIASFVTTRSTFTNSLLLLILFWQGDATIPTITDSKTNTWTKIAGGYANFYGMAVFACINGGSGSITISISWGTNATGCGYQLCEMIGCAASSVFDGYAYNDQHAGAPVPAGIITSGSFTTAVNGDVIFGVCYPEATGNIFSPGQGWTPLQTSYAPDGKTICLISEMVIQPLAGSAAAQFVLGSGYCAPMTIGIALKQIVTTTWNISTNVIGSGNVVPSGVVPVPQGNSLDFIFTPATGHEVTSVIVDGVSQIAGGDYEFLSVAANHTLAVTFGLVTYTVTATAGSNGTISPGTTTVNYGGSQAFAITPANGYQVANVVVDGTSVGAVTSYTFSNVTANHTISATFSLQSGYAPTGTGTAAAITICPQVRFQAFYPGTSIPLSGGELWTLQPGTTPYAYPKTTYTDSTSQTANANPVKLDSNGQADLWLVGPTKLVLLDSAGNLVWSKDNVV